MDKIIQINKSDEETLSDLLRIWESAVVETHTFLSNKDIQQIKPDVKLALANITYLYGYAEDNQILGFTGIEMTR